MDQRGAEPGGRFTLIHLMMAIAAAAVAAGTVTVLLRPVLYPPPARMGATMAMVKNLEIALRQYDFDFGEYPPDASQDPRFDLSSECLVYYLGTAFRRTPTRAGQVAATKNGGPYFEFGKEYLIDSDRDGFPEFVDYFGRPFCYDNLRDDPAGYTDCSHRTFGADPRGGASQCPNSYDVWSLGNPKGKYRDVPIANFRLGGSER